MKNKFSLDQNQEQEYNALWEQANSIAKMNDRCSSISLNEVIDEECQHFYEIDLPQFEAKFFELTGEFKLNAVKASNSLSDKRAMIEACVNALSPESYQVSSIITVIGEVTPEPLENDLAMIRYNLALGINDEKKEAIKSRLEKWYEACGDAITSQGDFSPLFIQKINKQNRHSKTFFDIKGNLIRLITGQQERFSYYINDRLLFGKSNAKGTPLLSITKNGIIGFANMSNISWKSYAIFPEKEIKQKGFNGRIVWGKRPAPRRNIRALKNGKVIKSVVIGQQEWFAMDYGTGDWDKAKKTCPSGWHLPSDDDWRQLGNFVRDNSYEAPIGISLRAAFGWKKPGIDLYGFSAKPDTYYGEDNENIRDEECVVYWSSNNSGETRASRWMICGENLKNSSAKKLNSYTIRCIKNNEIHF